jgi:hypothetical protein
MGTMDINTNDLWLCKTSFTEANANEIKCKEAYAVVIVMEPDNLNGEEFVRVQPISKQIEYRTEEDILVEDKTLLGYPFIIETWNEQPIITKLLDKKLGSVQDMVMDTDEPDEYTDEQLTFRKSEIRRTAFLRQSVLSHMANSESSEYGKKKNVARTIQLMSYAATIIGVILLMWQPHKPTKKEFIAQYQVVKPIELGNDYQENLLRGEDVRVEGFSEQESMIIQLALKKYKEKDFKGASTLFEKVPDLLNKNSEICFYAALSNLYDKNTLYAITSFEDLRDIKSFKYEDDILYYLAIAYAKEGEARKARKVLNELNTLSPEYLNDKPNMIKDLRWFLKKM